MSRATASPARRRCACAGLALRHHDAGLVGRPVLYFEPVRDFRARTAYCDVGDALRAELGLPARP